MKISQVISETTAGATASGSVASVAKPMGKVQKRAGNLLKGKTTKKPFYEDEIVEQDLIIVPGQGRKLKPGFIAKDKDRTDHEVEMARSDLFQAAKNAQKVYMLIKNISEEQGLEGWVQEKIIKANDYLNTIREYLEHKTHVHAEGVIAGGGSNFEEDYVNEISDFKKKEIEWELRNEPANNYAVHIDGRKWKVFKDKAHAEAVAKKLRSKGKDVKVHLTGERPSTNEANTRGWSKAESFFDKMLELRNKAKMAAERGRFKELELINKSLEELENQILTLPKGKLYLDNMYKQLGSDILEAKCPECGGEMVSEELMSEKKDACYHKVKARYKVWPSAYASGALVKCRKKGASNWGTGKKK